MIGGGGGFGEIHAEEHNWDEMDGSVKVEKRFLWSWVVRVVRGGRTAYQTNQGMVDIGQGDIRC